MPRYIDTSKVTIPEGFFEGLNVPKLLEWLNNQPTADVVPKSELSILAVQNMALAQARHDMQIRLENERELSRALTSEIEKAARNKVAREIIAEIEKLILRYFNDDWYTVPDMHCDIEKLKKKYTEGETDDNKIDSNL